jgi:succinate dehydrogenase / fumarate reductase cytochrome b subunit
MKQKIRPLSPHLTIYKPQLTSVLSIFHRITGSTLGLFLILSFILYYYNLFFVGFSFSYCLLFDFYVLCFIFVNAIGYFLFSVLVYHMMNGIRHLSWDLAFGLEIKNLYTSGVMVLGLVFVIVLITIFI